MKPADWASMVSWFIRLRYPRLSVGRLIRKYKNVQTERNTRGQDKPHSPDSKYIKCIITFADYPTKRIARTTPEVILVIPTFIGHTVCSNRFDCLGKLGLLWAQFNSERRVSGDLVVLGRTWCTKLVGFWKTLPLSNLNRTANSIFFPVVSKNWRLMLSTEQNSLFFLAKKEGKFCDFLLELFGTCMCAESLLNLVAHKPLSRLSPPN